MNINTIDPVALTLFLGGLALLPLLMVCTTSFLKISVVLLIVRNALGIQQVPPSIALNGMALAATLFVMAPVFQQITDRLPIGGDSAAKQTSIKELAFAAEPLREFMLANTLPEKRQTFVALAQRQWKASGMTASERDYVVLIPCFVVSELELALKAGFVLYIPFVVVDLLLSNLLLALGMQMVSPMVVSLPLKVLLFVMLDGWTRLFDGLVRSYS